MNIKWTILWIMFFSLYVTTIAAQMQPHEVSLIENGLKKKIISNASIYIKVPSKGGSYRSFNPISDVQGKFIVHLHPGQGLHEVVFNEITKSNEDSSTFSYKVRKVDVINNIIYVSEIASTVRAHAKFTEKNKKSSKSSRLLELSIVGIQHLSVDRAMIKIDDGSWLNLEEKWRTNTKLKSIDQSSVIKISLTGADNGSFEAIHENEYSKDTLATHPYWRIENNGQLIVITFYPKLFASSSSDTLRNLIIEGTQKIRQLKEDFNAQIDTFERKLDTLRAKKHVNQEELNKLAQDFANYRQKMQKEIRRITNTMIISLLPYNDSLRNKLLKEPIDTVLNFLNNKNAEIKRLKVAQAIQKKRASQMVIIVSTLGVLIILLLVLWYFKKLRATNRSLTSKNTLINLLIGEVNHRVKNNLFAISSKLRNSHLTSDNEATKVMLTDMINFTSKLTQLQAKLDFTFFSNNQTTIGDFQIEKELMDMTKTVVETSALKCTPQIQVNNNLSHLRNDNFSIIGFCAFELVNNICKYAFRSIQQDLPKIDISLSKNGTYISLQIIDNGQGITQELFDEKGGFDFEKLHSSKGLKIINHLTILQHGFFRVKTQNVHQDLLSGSYFECNFKF